MSSTTAPVCYTCKHRIYLMDNPPTCEAFPAGIPDSIFWEGDEHKEPIKGQVGKIVYEAAGKEPE